MEGCSSFIPLGPAAVLPVCMHGLLFFPFEVYFIVAGVAEQRADPTSVLSLPSKGIRILRFHLDTLVPN